MLGKIIMTFVDPFGIYQQEKSTEIDLEEVNLVIMVRRPRVINLGIICTPCLFLSEITTTPDLTKWTPELSEYFVSQWRSSGTFNKELYAEFKQQKAKKIDCHSH